MLTEDKKEQTEAVIILAINQKPNAMSDHFYHHTHHHLRRCCRCVAVVTVIIVGVSPSSPSPSSSGCCCQIVLFLIAAQQITNYSSFNTNHCHFYSILSPLRHRLCNLLTSVSYSSIRQGNMTVLFGANSA